MGRILAIDYGNKRVGLLCLHQRDDGLLVGLLRRLRRELPDLPVHEIDERFTSRMAHAAMLAGGLGQKARRDKATVDRISAALILQSFLESPTAIKLLGDS